MMMNAGIYISPSTLAHGLTISVIAATIAWFLFLVVFTLLAKWWKNPYGRNAFGVSFVLFVILFRIMVLRIWPDIEQKDFVGIIVYSLAGIFAIQRGILMVRAQWGLRKMPVLYNRRHDDAK